MPRDPIQAVYRSYGRGIGSTSNQLVIFLSNEDGIDPHESPNYNCINIGFDSYAQIHDTTINTMRRRTVYGKSLRPSNEHGRYYLCH